MVRTEIKNKKSIKVKIYRVKSSLFKIRTSKIFVQFIAIILTIKKTSTR